MTQPSRSAGVSEQELESLMIRYQQADEAAAAKLIQALTPMLYRFLASSNFGRVHVEDLLQEVWLRLHRARHSYRPGAPVLPWVFAIARNTRVDGLRRRIRAESRETPLDDFREATLGAEDRRAASNLDFETMLRQLPESQREVITMLKVSGMSLEEVARATQTTVGAVKQKAHRAYEKLRRFLAVDNTKGADA